MRITVEDLRRKQACTEAVVAYGRAGLEDVDWEGVREIDLSGNEDWGEWLVVNIVHHITRVNRIRFAWVKPVLSETDSDGQTWRYEYDSRNNRVYTTGPGGRTWRYEYDDGNNRVSQTDPDGRTWRYEYDSRNNRVSETDPDGRTWTYKYDSRNNRVSETHPDGRTWTYKYDSRNNRVSETHPSGCTLRCNSPEPVKIVLTMVDGTKIEREG